MAVRVRGEGGIVRSDRRMVNPNRNAGNNKILDGLPADYARFALRAALRACPSIFLPLKPQILKPRAHPSSGATWASLPVADMYEATVARGSNLRTCAYPFRRASFVFCERLFFCLSTRSTRQHSRKQYARTIGGKLALLARARSVKCRQSVLPACP